MSRPAESFEPVPLTPEMRAFLAEHARPLPADHREPTFADLIQPEPDDDGCPYCDDSTCPACAPPHGADCGCAECDWRG